MRRWGLLLGGVLGAQGLAQLCNALSGLLVVRFLPRESAYAWFTVASSTLIMVALLSDSGVAGALQAVGGPLWEDRTKFSAVVHAAHRRQRWLILAAVAFGVSWMLVLLRPLHASAAVMTGAALLVILAAWPAATGALLSHVNRIHARLRPQLVAELSSAVTRLTLTVAAVGLLWWLSGGTLAAWPELAFLCVLAAAVAATWVLCFLVQRSAADLVDVSSERSEELDGRVRSIVAGSVVFTLYYGLQGQVSTWLMSLTGASAQVADVGALGRLALLFSLATAPVVQFAMPAFARCRERDKLRRQLCLTVGMFLLFSASILLLVTVLPEPFLWLLGPQYAHLTTELRLAVLVPALTGLCGITWGLVMARGWIRHSSWVAPVGLAAQAVGLFLFDLKTVTGVLGFNLFILLPILLFAVLVIWRTFVVWPSES